MNNFCRKCFQDFEATANQIKKSDWICKDCKKKQGRAYREAKKAQGLSGSGTKMPREYHANYEAEYKTRPGVMEKKAAQAREYRRGPNRNKHEARWKVARAIISGKLKKLSCVVCGDDKSEAHHEDYNKPLDVVWLCRKHHNEHHAKAEGKSQ